MSSWSAGLHHTQLAMPAGQEAIAKAFYVDILGMEEIPKPEALRARGGAWFRHGPLEVHLGVEEGFQPARKAHPGILVRGIDDVAQRLLKANCKVLWDDDFPGYRRFYSADPFENRLEFLEPIPETVG